MLSKLGNNPTDTTLLILHNHYQIDFEYGSKLSKNLGL